MSKTHQMMKLNLHHLSPFIDVLVFFTLCVLLIVLSKMKLLMDSRLKNFYDSQAAIFVSFFHQLPSALLHSFHFARFLFYGLFYDSNFLDSFRSSLSLCHLSVLYTLWFIFNAFFGKNVELLIYKQCHDRFICAICLT